MGLLENMIGGAIIDKYGDSPQVLKARHDAKLKSISLQGKKDDYENSNFGSIKKLENLERENKLKAAETTKELAPREKARKNRVYAEEERSANLNKELYSRVSELLKLSPEDLSVAGYSISVKDGKPIMVKNDKKKIWGYNAATGGVSEVASIGKDDVVKNQGMTPNELENNSRKLAGYESTRKAKTGEWEAPDEALIQKYREQLQQRYTPEQQQMLQSGIEKRINASGIDTINIYDTEEEIKYAIRSGELNTGDKYIYKNEVETVG